MLKLSIKDRDELADAEAAFPGTMWVEAATRYWVRIRVNGNTWEFREEEGVFVLVSKPLRRMPRQQYRFAFLRAREIIHAIRQGHKEATEKRGCRKKVSPAAARQIGFKF